jgi:hypothetical protein
MILAAAACIFGFVVAVPALSPTLSPLPTAGADVLGNGYDVNCTKANDSQVVCTVAGCPRVFEDLAGDIVHTHINGDAGAGIEADKACGNTYSRTIDTNQAFTFHVQGCREHTIGTDDCGPYSVYQYTPPAVQPINCPAGSKSATVVPPAQCEAAPKVKCPEGSPTADAVSLDQCAPIPPKDCPPGSVNAQAAPGQQCAPPENVITMTITGNPGGNANISINNNSAIPASCNYNAKKQSGVGPGSVDRQVNVPPNGTGTIDDLLFPVLASYNASVKCTGTWDGKQVTLGTASQSVP